MRLFVAFELPECVVRSLAEAWQVVLGRLRGARHSLKLVPCQNYHLTVRFLGELSRDRLPDLQDLLAEAAATAEPLRCQLTGLGAFPESSRPRVFWAGVGDDGSAARAAALVDEALVELGFQREERPWRPHVTLARVRRGCRLPDCGDALAAAALSDQPFGIEHLTLMHSRLDPGGAVHSPLARFGLGSVCLRASSS